MQEFLWFGLKAVGLMLGLVISAILLVVAYTLVLAGITWWRFDFSKKKFKTTLMEGHVHHTRMQPVIHAFKYPIFFALLHLDEAQELFLNNPKKRPALWPLTNIMQFRQEDHLKNLQAPSVEEEPLQERVLKLVSERTNLKFRPTALTHSVVLLTHLRYYGYCFNPVSFCFILLKNDDKQKRRKCDCIVAEVSNTPWNEMHTYVLHPDSVDVTSVKTTQQHKINAIFPKTFHVSPFMEMNYIYDWTFDEYFLEEENQIQVVAKMLLVDMDTPAKEPPHFCASFQVQRSRKNSPQQLSPWSLAFVLLKYPVYCAIVQIWIHYEAFWLFVKGVTFIPHPEGAETRASRAIAKIMTPLFAAKDWVQEKFNNNKDQTVVDDDKKNS